MNARRRQSAMERIENTLAKLVDLDRWLIDRHFPMTNQSIDPLSIPWAPAVAARWPDIRRELDDLLATGIQMPDINEVMGEELGAEGPWTTYILFSFGSWVEANAARCPATAEVCRGIPDLEIAGFTVLDGGTHIPLHRGPFRALRYQLGVRVPEPIGACRLQVADEVIVWEDGKSLAFDDACEHEAWNDTDEARYVFFVQTRWPLPGWEGVAHRAIHRVLALAARSVPAKAEELDHALNGWR
ncbi:MAG: aspartyl/asparaginyl beta-hydroxylase domain-containing protein [Microthrixaceae bacterium]|nr:aspartyl/asparaginyl beta-hydroxylase domain-containing protein [Microthrixaceae bacterium]